MIFECTGCGTHYMPPETMRYPDGPASPLWCSRCQADQRAAGRTEDPLLARIALAAARASLTPPPEEQSRPDVRPSRPPVSRRARSGPGGMRTKLA